MGGSASDHYPFYCSICCVTCYWKPIRLAEIVFYRKKIQRHRLMEAPLFILGHWRSGTSHLQHLLSQDSAIATNTNYRNLFADNYLFSENWLKPPLNTICKTLKLPYSIQRTIMDLDLPAELDLAVCINCSEYSYSWGHIFPRRFEHWFNRNVLSSSEDKRWIEDYDFMIRKLSHHSGGKRVIVKSPGDCARVQQLLSRYPAAKFVYIHRDPIAVFHSNRYLWKVVQRENSLQRIDQAEIDRLNYPNIQEAPASLSGAASANT